METALKNVLGFGVQDFIEKAIEGGWIGKGLDSWSHDVFQGIQQGENHPNDINTIAPQCLLSPLAWKAVGKTEGWEELGEDINFACGTIWGVQANFHRFIDELYKLDESD